jgi:DNA modification methylase
MKYYYEDKWVKIIHGDCREVIPQLDTKFDLILTDPPYGIGEAKGKNKSRSVMAVSKDFGTLDWDDAPIDFDLISKCVDMGKKAIVFGGNYYPLTPSKCWLIWDKENGENDFADCEMAWINLDMAVRIFHFRWQGMLQGDMKNKEYRYHPTQEPIPVMKWCVSKANIPVETILDPFMGSGTTCIAAKELNKYSVGIEISEKYCEIAAKRLAQEVMELGL